MIHPEVIDCTAFPGSYKVEFVSSVKFAELRESVSINL